MRTKAQELARKILPDALMFAEFAKDAPNLQEFRERTVKFIEEYTESLNAWQPIETHDSGYEPILVYIKSPVTGNTWMEVVSYNDHYEAYMSGTRHVGRDFITHWMSLPQPPKKETNDE